LWAANEKIVIQRISGGANPIVAAIDRNRFKTFASVNNMLLKDEYKNLYCYVLALLNSRLLNYFYANNFSNNSTLTVNISKTFLEKLPIVEIDEKKLKEFNVIVGKIMSLAQSLTYHENKALQARIKEYEGEINVMVYELYGLTKDEIKIVEGFGKED